MLNRDRESLKQWRQEEAERERLAKEERERPVREATETLLQSHRKLAALERERLTGSIPDPDKWVDDALVGPTVKMTVRQAETFNEAQIAEFKRSHPHVYWCEALVELLGTYFTANGLKLVTAAMLAKLTERLASVGLLPERPVEPEPEPAIEEPAPVVAEPETHVGIDPLTGNEREYSAREVDRMTADDYRRAFKITKKDITLPTHAKF